GEVEHNVVAIPDQPDQPALQILFDLCVGLLGQWHGPQPARPGGIVEREPHEAAGLELSGDGRLPGPGRSAHEHHPRHAPDPTTRAARGVRLSASLPGAALPRWSLTPARGSLGRAAGAGSARAAWSSWSPRSGAGGAAPPGPGR